MRFSSTSRIWLLLALLHAVPFAVGGAAGFGAGLICLMMLHLGLVGFTLWTGSTPFCRAVQGFSWEERELVLTVDDGPCADTLALLDLLDQFSAKAVFFLIGARARSEPHLVREMVARGHGIGNHTTTHPAYTFWAYGPAAQKREISTAQAILQAASGGRSPVWFRAPAGFRNPFTGAILRDSKLGYLGWTARGLDTRETDPEVVMGRLRKGIRPGGILLLHQGHPHSLLLLRKLLEELAAGGWRTRLPPDPILAEGALQPAAAPGPGAA